MGQKSRNSWKAHLGSLLNVRIKFQLPSSKITNNRIFWAAGRGAISLKNQDRQNGTSGTHFLAQFERKLCDDQTQNK